MGAKLNEVAAHYSQEGWDHFYLVVVGTDCKILHDMFSKLFRPPEMVDPMKVESTTTKKAHTEAEKFKEEALHQEGGLDTAKLTVVYPTCTTIPHTIGITSDYYPVVTPTEETSKASRKLVSKTYYQCVICSHRGQNKNSTFTHMHHHLNVSLACSWPNCKKSYEAPEGFKNHVNKKQVAPEALNKEEAESVVSSLSTK